MAGNSVMYSNIAMYVAGNILSLLLILVLYQINTVMAEFRDPMVYALLTSIALRLPKDSVVKGLESLATSETRIMFLPFRLLFVKPFEMIIQVWKGGRRVLRDLTGPADGKRRSGWLIALARISSKDKKSSKKMRREGSGKLSNKLLWLLFYVCVAQVGYEWIRDTWSKMSQVILVGLLSLGLVGTIVISCIEYFFTFDVPYGPLSPRKSPQKKTKKKHGGGPVDTSQSPSVEEHEEGEPTMSRGRRLFDTFMVPIDTVDGRMKKLIRANAHSLVSAFLVLSLVVGTAISAAFLGFQIVGEGRSTVIMLKNTVSDPWSFGEGVKFNQTLQTAHMLQNLSWLSTYRVQLSEFVQGSFPAIFEWIEEKSDRVLESHNLTEAAMEGRYLMEYMRGPRVCSEDEKDKLFVALSKATYKYNLAVEEENHVLEDVAASQGAYLDALAQYKNADFTTVDHQRVVESEALLRETQDTHATVTSTVAKTLRAKVVAEQRLSLCVDSIHLRDGMHHQEENTLLTDVGSVLHSGYRKIATDWDFYGGIQEIVSGFHDVWSSVLHENSTVVAQGGSPANGGLVHLDSLQSMAVAAMGPLVTIGKAVFMSFESTTSAALAGSASLFRLGAGVLEFGMQSLLFLSLLFALLSAENDPVVQVIQFLPFPPKARTKAADALNKSLGGVFVTMIKLGLIHGLFTWVTFKAFGAPLIYTSSTVSAFFSLLPLISPYMVVIPSVIALAIQGRIVSGLLLFALHVAAASFGDDSIIEEAGGQPFQGTLMSMSILGGMAFYPNPFLGCLFGPILLGILYALGAILQELMATTGEDHGESDRRLL
jgi:hypothetical protein